jgi:hypothetical protein
MICVEPHVGQKFMKIAEAAVVMRLADHTLRQQAKIVPFEMLLFAVCQSLEGRWRTPSYPIGTMPLIGDVPSEYTPPGRARTVPVVTG